MKDQYLVRRLEKNTVHMFACRRETCTDEVLFVAYLRDITFLTNALLKTKIRIQESVKKPGRRGYTATMQKGPWLILLDALRKNGYDVQEVKNIHEFTRPGNKKA